MPKNYFSFKKRSGEKRKRENHQKNLSLKNIRLSELVSERKLVSKFDRSNKHNFYAARNRQLIESSELLFLGKEIFKKWHLYAR